MKKRTTKAIILRRVNYGEADRILTVITSTHGKLSLFAKGARRSKSKLAGGLELFCVSDVDFIDSPKDLKTVVSTRLDRNFTDVVKNMDVALMAYDFLKVIDNGTEPSCDDRYFVVLMHALESLHEGLPTKLAQSWFYANVLLLGGRSVNVDAQVNGAPYTESAQYTFDFDHMGFVEHESGLYASQHIKFMKLLLRADHPRQLMRVEGAGELASVAAHIMTSAFQTDQHL